MPEVKQKCCYCEHVMADRFMYYDEKDESWYCRSMQACVHRIEIARKYARPPLGFVFERDKHKHPADTP
jgi:hypothetical protein